jgi:CRP/FNR family cyclic AMP-dependent transcriptional regulator
VLGGFDSVVSGSGVGVVLREQGMQRSFRDGSALFGVGDPAEEIFLIKRGWVTLALGTPAGGEVILRLSGPGDIVGELSVLVDEPRTAPARAVDAVEAVVAPARILTAALTRDAALAGELLRLLAVRLRDADRQRQEFAGLDSLARVARRLLELTERFGEATDDGLRVELPLSQEQLASRCGCSREATVKALRTLREIAGVTTGRRTVTLRDPELLRQHARLA